MLASPLDAVLWLPLILIGSIAAKVFYNLYLHPLRSYPGPLLARASILVYHRKLLQGYSHYWIHDLHKAYGPVVRIAPGKLSSIEPAAWKDIYGHRATSLTKSLEFYGPDAYGDPPGLIRADNVAHARQRKTVSNAFSDKALRDQEPLLKGYVGQLIGQLQGMAAQAKQFNIVEWYNFTTFDIMADLTFGESLYQLSDSSYHPWVKSIFSYVKIISISQVIRGWPGSARLLQWVVPKDAQRKREMHLKFASESIDKRMARKTDRADIWTFVTRHSEAEGGLKPTELHSNGSLFMIAGTETTATELSGLTYLLLKNPDRMERLKEEIRSTFSSFDDMTMTKLSQLKYLGACIEEGLRYYPPVPAGLPRMIAPDGASICGRWVAGGTVIQCPMYSMYHSPTNFKNPDAFVPERFLPEGQEEYGSDRREALNPFSTGPRNCLGKNLAYHEMRLMLASVMFHFDLTLCDEENDWLYQEMHLIWDKTPLMVKLTAVN